MEATMIRRHVLLMLAAAPVACTPPPNPTLYTIVTMPGPPRAGAPHVIELRQIALAGYPKRLQIVRSSQDVRLDVLDDELWAEQFDAMLTRVLAEELSAACQFAAVRHRLGY